MNRKFKPIASVLLSLALVIISTCSVFAEPLKKNETVYIKLDSAGKVQNEQVVNWIDINGQTVLSEETSLDSIKIIPDLIKPDIRNGILNLNLKGIKERNLFFTGTTKKDIPVTAQISYLLNGSAIDPKDLAGKGGDIEIKINLKNNTKSDDTINYTDTATGKSMSYQQTTYVPMAANVALDLPLDKFYDIDAPASGTVVLGKTMKLNWIKFPYPEENIDIKFKTEKFELDPIQITLLPQMPPITSLDIGDKLKTMYDGINLMDNSAGLLTNGFSSLYDGINQESMGMSQLSSKAPEISAGITKIISSVDNLSKAGDAQVQMMGNISGINTQLQEKIKLLAKTPGMSDTAAQLLAALQQQQGLINIMSSGGKLPNGTEFPGLSITNSGLKALSGGMQTYKSGIDQSFGAIQQLNSGMQKLNFGVNQLKNGSVQLKTQGIGQLKTGVADSINEVTKGQALLKRMQERVDSMKSFTGGAYKSGKSAEYIMQTDAIKVAKK